MNKYKRANVSTPAKSYNNIKSIRDKFLLGCGQQCFQATLKTVSDMNDFAKTAKCNKKDMTNIIGKIAILMKDIETLDNGCGVSISQQYNYPANYQRCMKDIEQLANLAENVVNNANRKKTSDMMKNANDFYAFSQQTINDCKGIKECKNKKLMEAAPNTNNHTCLNTARKLLVLMQSFQRDFNYSSKDVSLLIDDTSTIIK